MRAQKLVDNGPHPPPGETGAKFIIREDGRRINLAFMGSGQDRRLEYGDKVGGCMGVVQWSGASKKPCEYGDKVGRRCSARDSRCGIMVRGMKKA